MKKLFLTLLILCSFLKSSPSWADSVLTLSQAWTKARQNSLPISTQAENLRLAQLRRNLTGVWDDPVLEYSSGGKDTSQGSSKLSTWSLRQKIPSGPDQKLEKLSAQGELNLEGLKSIEVEKDLESKFVLSVYELKALRAQLQHSIERMQRIAGIRNFLKSTKAYTSSAELDRALIELRIREIEDRKISIQTQIQRSKMFLDNQGLEGIEVQASWVTADDLKLFVEQKPLLSILAKRSLEQFQTRKAQAEVSLFRPQFDIFASRAQEVGGSEERSQSVGIGVTLPFFSYLSDKKTYLKTNALVSEMQWEMAQRQDTARWKELQKLIEQAVYKMQMLSESSLDKIRKSTPTFEAALKKGQITIAQFLDYEDRVHSQVDSFYENQIRSVEVAAAASLYFDSSLVTAFRGSHE